MSKQYVMLLEDDYSHHAWVYFLKHKSDSGGAFRIFWAGARTDGVRSKVAVVKSDNDRELFVGEFGEVCRFASSKNSLTH